MSEPLGRGSIALYLAAALACAACSSSAPAAGPAGPLDAAPPVDGAAAPDAAGEGAHLPIVDSGAPTEEASCGCKSGTVPLSAVAGASCTFTWPAGTQIDALLVNVAILDADADAGMLIVPMDPSNGWDFDDRSAPTQIVLHGSSCTTYEAATAPQVEIVLGCYTMVPPVC